MPRTLLSHALPSSRRPNPDGPHAQPSLLRAIAGLAFGCALAHGAAQAARAQIAPAPVQPAAQPAVQPVLQPALPALPRVGQRPYVDEALFAREAIAKAIELDDAGNNVEAVRILHDILQREGEQLVSQDSDLWITVRDRVHSVLMAKPALLEKYVLENAAQANALLAAGELGVVEQTFAMTPAGLEAMLRIAQLDIEAGRFSAASIMHARAKAHPLAGNERDAIDSVARSLAAMMVRADASREGKPERMTPVQAFAPFAGGLFATTPQTPLRTLALAQEPTNVLTQRRNLNRFSTNAELAAWVFPTRIAERVFINDGAGIIAADAATLSPLWRTNTTEPLLTRQADDFWMMGDRMIDDGSFVAVGSGIAVAALGRPVSGRRLGDTRVIAVRATDGSELWNIEPQWSDPRLQEGFVRGAPLIDSDVVVLGVRKPGLSRRITSLYLVGLDLFTGEVRYVRPVGSVGTQPWSPAQGRVEGAVLHDGYVYRGDDLGVFGAFEAHTGRPAWVRSFLLGEPNDPMESRTANPTIKAFEVVLPVTAGGSVFWIDPGTQGVVQIDRATGKVLASRSAGDVGEPRYLLQAGNALVCVGRFSVTALPIDGFGTSQPRRLGAISSEGFVGRAIVAGDEVLLPVASGVIKVPIASLLSEAAPPPALPVGGVVPADQGQGAQSRDFAIVPLTASGNLLLVEDVVEGSTASHLLVSDVRGVSSFLSWERAREQLTARLKASPKDPSPALTLLELSLRMGQPQDVPTLADKVLAMSRGLDGAGSRRRLFAALAEALAVSRRAPATRNEASPGVGVSSTRPLTQTLAQQPLPAIEDKALLEALATRLLPAADDAWQRAVAQFEVALAQDNLGKGKDAIASVQAVLLDAGLASVDFALVGRASSSERDSGSRAMTAWGEPGRSVARDIATDMLWTLVAKHGPASYSVFEDQARGAVQAALAAPAGAQRTRLLASTAVKYPCAVASIEALEAAASTSASPIDARLLLGEALTRALRSATANTQASQQRIAVLVASLDAQVRASLQAKRNSPLQDEPMARLLARIARDHPALRIARGAAQDSALGSETGIAELAAQWREQARSRSDRTPQLSMGLSEPSAKTATDNSQAGDDPLLLLRADALPQVLPGWDLREALVYNDASSADVFLAYEPRTKSIAAFARSALASRVEQLWIRPASPDGIVIHSSSDRTLVYWPAEGGMLEAIDNTTGLAAWTATRLRDLRDKDEQATALLARWPDRFSTPLGGSVRPDDVLIAMTNNTCTLVERSGFVASFSLTDGAVQSSGQSPFAVVYDVDAIDNASNEAQSTSLIAISGAMQSQSDGEQAKGLGRLVASACVIDALTGAPTMLAKGEQLGEHARWVRMLPDRSMLVATAEGVARFAAANDGTARLLWRAHDADLNYSVTGYVVGESVMVMDTDLKLWRVGLVDGAFGKGSAIDARDRISIPFEAHAVKDAASTGLVLTSGRGMVSLAQNGKLMGLDALQAAGRIEPGLLGRVLGAASDVQMIVSVESGEQSETAVRVSTPARVVFLRCPDLSLLAETKVGLPDAPTSLALRDGLVIVGQEAGLVLLRAGEE